MTVIILVIVCLSVGLGVERVPRVFFRVERKGRSPSKRFPTNSGFEGDRPHRPPSPRREWTCTTGLVWRSWWSWGVLSGSGLVVLLLPDTGPRLFSLSEEHGPSLVDAIGVLLLLVGWAVLDVATWRRRRGLSLRIGGGVLITLTGLAAIVLVLWSVLGDHGAWWIVGATLLAAIQLAAAVRATLVERPSAHR